MGLNVVRITGLGVFALVFTACNGVQEPPPKGRPDAIEALKAAPPLQGDYHVTAMMTDDRPPAASQLSARLGVVVEAVPNEPYQFILRAEPGSVDVSALGTINTDTGYAVGLTLPSGTQIGFRYLAK